METILSIAGKPGLYKMIKRGKMNLIIETIDESHHRTPAFATDRITSLGDIAIYTENDDVPLWKVLANIAEKENNKPIEFNYRKANGNELRKYFEEILPEFDPDRVHNSDIKKVFVWYDILTNNGYSDFETLLSPEKKEGKESENTDDSQKESNKEVKEDKKRPGENTGSSADNSDENTEDKE